MTTAIGLTLEIRDPDWRDLAPMLDEAEALGLDFAELPLPNLPIIRGARVVQERLASVRSATAGRRLAYSLHGHLGINLMEEPFRIGLHLDLLRANIEVAAELGARHLVIHSGFVPVTQAAGIEAAYDRQRTHLAAMGEVARDHGVTLCVENIFEFQGRRATALPGRLARELAAIGHPNVAATFDISHGWLHCHQEGADFLVEAQALAPFARHLHLHDSFGRPDDFWTYTPFEAMAFGIGDLHMPPGWGSVPWAGLAERCTWPASLMGDLEIAPQHRSAHAEAVATARAWLSTLRGPG
jgi:sugar phosphate isomerase/epimerase